MMKVQPYKLREMFRSDSFAWEILQQQVKLQTNGISIDGQDIARLLALYMKGVETLNSMRDSRQFFFRNRLNDLMMRPCVVQVLSRGTKSNQEVKQQPKINSKQSPEHRLRKAELEMRVTYAQHEHDLQNMKKAFVEHECKANIYTNTVQTVVSESRSKLQERIKQRKLRSVTTKQRSIQAYEDNKPLKPELNTLQTLGQIKEEAQYNAPRKKQRSQSLDLKTSEDDQPYLGRKTNKGMSLIIPSSSRKESDEFRD